MSEYYGQEPTDDAKRSATIIGIVFLGIGLLLGWGIGSDRAWSDAGNWAVRTTRHCEASYRTEGFSSVTDCLKGTIAKAEEEQREEKRAEGYDPRR